MNSVVSFTKFLICTSLQGCWKSK